MFGVPLLLIFIFRKNIVMTKKIYLELSNQYHTYKTELYIAMNAMNHKYEMDMFNSLMCQDKTEHKFMNASFFSFA